MTKQESPYLIIDRKANTIEFSPNIKEIFELLIDIEKEVKSFLGIEEKLSNIRSEYRKMLDLCRFLAEKLEENNIDCEYKLKGDFSKLLHELQFDIPARSQLIVLFSYLETLFCLHISYTEQTEDDSRIRKSASDGQKVKKFLREYCFTDRNPWYAENKSRGLKISEEKFRHLRNSLVHFFSLTSEIFLVDSTDTGEKTGKPLEERGQSNTTFISTKDFQEIIKGVFQIMMEEWEDEFKTNQKEFNKKILCVQSVAKRHKPIFVRYDSHRNS